MTNIDQFESIFKKADKPPFHLEPVDLDRMLVISDVGLEQTDKFMHEVIEFLGETLLGHEIDWHRLCGQDHQSVGEVVEKIVQIQPDLICTFRNLHAPARDYPYSLGVYLDVLSQATDIPVLALPSPHHASTFPNNTKTVMAIADHLTGDSHLVSYAARLTSPNGKLILSHVEDQRVFERYMSVIGKIQSIETDNAREVIQAQLLAEPKEFIAACAKGVENAKLPIEVIASVGFGSGLSDYRTLVESYDVDLLVLNTKQDDQLAMHGLAYPLCVELRDTPILML